MDAVAEELAAQHAGILPAQGEFEAAGGHFRVVALRGGSAEDVRQGRAHRVHVQRTALVDVAGEGQPAVQEAQVDTAVEGLGRLPGQGLGHRGRGGGVADLLPVDDGTRAEVEGLVVGVHAHVTVAQGTVGTAELDVGDDVLVHLEPRLLAHAPTGGNGREERPALAGRELGGTVVTAVHFEEIALGEVVVHAEERAGRAPLGIVALDGLVVQAHGEVQVVHVRGEQAVVVGIRALERLALVVVTEQELEVVEADSVLKLRVLVGGDIVVGAEGFADVIGQTLDFGQGLDDALIAGERGRKPVNVGVVGTGPVGEVRVEAEAVVQERRLGADGVLRLPVRVLAVAGSVQDVTHGIHAAVGERAVRVQDRGAGVAFIGDVAPDVAVAFALGFRHHVLAVGDAGVGRHLEPVRHLVTHLHAAVVQLVGVRVHLAVKQTVVVVQTGRHIVVELVVGAGDGEVVRLGEREVLVQGVIVVHALGEVEPAALRAERTVGNEDLVVPGLRALAVFLQPRRGEFHRLVDGGRVAALVVVPGQVEVLRPGVTVGDHVRHGGRGFERQVRLVVHRGGPLLRALGGDEHHAVRRAGTIDGGRRGVLQDGHALDVVRVQQAGAALNTVDEHQRAAALADGSRTADVERRGGVRTTVRELEVQVRHAALEHLRQVRVRTSVEGLLAHRFHGAGEIGLLLGTVTHDHGLFEHFLVGGERNVDPGTALDGNLRRLVTDALDRQDSIGRDGDGIVTVHVGRRSRRGSFLHDTSTDDR